jgi:ribosomal protein S18 acetylase RimI-like enzyme
VREAAFPDDAAAIRRLFTEYAAGLGIDLCFQGFDAELAGLPGRYAAPAGGVWLAMQDQSAIGCVALRPLSDQRAEIKRLYVQPAFRGAGLGRRLAETAVQVAASKGYRSLCLDTLASMTGAIALYRSLGFVDIEPYYHNPLAGAVFLGRDLT